MRIAIVFNEPGTSPPPSVDGTVRVTADPGLVAELGVLDEVTVVQRSLVEEGHDVVVVPAGDASELVRRLAVERPDLVFNLCEAFQGRADQEMNVAGVFELLGIPYTGSPPLTLGTALHKPLAKAVLRDRGIGTPRYVVMEPGSHASALDGLSYPVIVKPVAEDASLGIDDGAVVHSASAVLERVRYVKEVLGQAALVEEFVPGREFHVSVLADSPSSFTVLPISEIRFDALAPGRPHILSYDAKWDVDAPFRQIDASECPAVLDVETTARIVGAARAAVEALGVRGYGRVDIRMRDWDGALFVIDVNPNPDLSEECEFARSVRTSGRTEAQAIAQIVRAAVERSASAHHAPATAPVPGSAPVPLVTDRLAHIARLTVDDSVISARFHADASMAHCSGRCCRLGVDVDIAERDRILHHAGTVQRLMHEGQHHDPASWFGEEFDDVDFPSGRAASTTVDRGQCVFLDAQQRCVLHRAESEEAVDGTPLKPFFCRAYPLTLDTGVLTLDRHQSPGEERCCGPVDGGSQTIVDVCGYEVEFVVGATGLDALRRMVQPR